MSSETTQPSHVTAMDGEAYATLQKSARDHLWMHFTRCRATTRRTCR